MFLIRNAFACMMGAGFMVLTVLVGVPWACFLLGAGALGVSLLVTPPSPLEGATRSRTVLSVGLTSMVLWATGDIPFAFAAVVCGGTALHVVWTQ